MDTKSDPSGDNTKPEEEPGPSTQHSSDEQQPEVENEQPSPELNVNISGDTEDVRKEGGEGLEISGDEHREDVREQGRGHQEVEPPREEDMEEDMLVDEEETTQDPEEESSSFSTTSDSTPNHLSLETILRYPGHSRFTPTLTALSSGEVEHSPAINKSLLATLATNKNIDTKRHIYEVFLSLAKAEDSNLDNFKVYLKPGLQIFYSDLMGHLYRPRLSPTDLTPLLDKVLCTITCHYNWKHVRISHTQMLITPRSHCQAN
eukprot:sb/3468431/